jgi:hypothetical protein
MGHATGKRAMSMRAGVCTLATDEHNHIMDAPIENAMFGLRLSNHIEPIPTSKAIRGSQADAASGQPSM